jgi:hypothetical protein
MYIDFGAGELHLARHESDLHRELARRELLRHSRAEQLPQRRWSKTIDRVRCELDYQRLVAAERLRPFRLAQSLLRADRSSFFSAGHCS